LDFSRPIGTFTDELLAVFNHVVDCMMMQFFHCRPVLEISEPNRTSIPGFSARVSTDDGAIIALKWLPWPQ